MTLKQFTKKLIKTDKIKSYNDYPTIENAVLIMFACNHIGDLIKNKIVFYQKDIKTALSIIDNYIGCGDENLL